MRHAAYNHPAAKSRKTFLTVSISVDLARSSYGQAVEISVFKSVWRSLAAAWLLASIFLPPLLVFGLPSGDVRTAGRGTEVTAEILSKTKISNLDYQSGRTAPEAADLEVTFLVDDPTLTLPRHRSQIVPPIVYDELNIGDEITSYVLRSEASWDAVIYNPGWLRSIRLMMAGLSMLLVATFIKMLAVELKD